MITTVAYIFTFIHHNGSKKR